MAHARDRRRRQAPALAQRGASHTFRFPTWDRFELPLPFARVQIAYGEPVQVPRVVNADGLADLQRAMATRLQALQAEARAALERRGQR